MASADDFDPSALYAINSRQGSSAYYDDDEEESYANAGVSRISQDVKGLSIFSKTPWTEYDLDLVIPDDPETWNFSPLFDSWKKQARVPVSSQAEKLMQWIAKEVSISDLVPLRQHAVKFDPLRPGSSAYRARLLQIVGLDSLEEPDGNDESLIAIQRLLGRFLGTLFSTGTEYVTFAKFFRGLLCTFDAFQQSDELQKAGGVYCIWLDSYKKSSMWCTLLLLHALMCESLGLQRGWIAPHFVLCGGIDYAKDLARKLPSNAIFVALDDASYSGTQMHSFLEDLNKWAKEINPVGEYGFCAIVPYVSNKAIAMIREIRNAQLFTTGTPMPSVNESMQTLVRLRGRGRQAWRVSTSVLNEKEKEAFFTQDLSFIVGNLYEIPPMSAETSQSIVEAMKEFDFDARQKTVEAAAALTNGRIPGENGASRNANSQAAVFADMPFNEVSFASELTERVRVVKNAAEDIKSVPQKDLARVKRVMSNAMERSDFPKLVKLICSGVIASKNFFDLANARGRFDWMTSRERLDWMNPRLTLAVFEHRMADSVSVPQFSLRAFLGIDRFKQTRESYTTFLNARDTKLRELVFNSQPEDKKKLVGIGVGSHGDWTEKGRHWNHKRSETHKDTDADALVRRLESTLRRR